MQFPVLTPAESLRMRPSRPVLIESRATPLVERGLIAINKATQPPQFIRQLGPIASMPCHSARGVKCRKGLALQGSRIGGAHALIS
jgi:hypothetical protein